MSRKSSRRTAGRSNRNHSRPSKSLVGRSLYHRRLRLEPLEERRLLAVVTVTTLADTVDFTDGLTSLREAIFATNLVPGADTINFAPALTASGPAKILLTQDELAITDPLTIDGPGADALTIDAQQQSRIFNITATTGDYLVAGLTLTGGKTGTHGFLDGMFSGGAIRSVSTGTLTLNQTTVLANSATFYPAAGGGVFAKGNLVLNQCTVTGNTSRGNGGGIYSSGNVSLSQSFVTDNGISFGSFHGGGIFAKGSVMLTECTVSGNTTSQSFSLNGYGGGISCQSDVFLDHSTVSNNRAAGGGGIQAGGSVTLDHTTINDNVAAGNGGGISARKRVMLTDSTVSGNAASSGGGIYCADSGSLVSPGSIGEVFAYLSTISGNTVDQRGGQRAGGGGIFCNGPVTLSASVISGNRCSGRGTNFYQGGGGGIRAYGFVTLNDSTMSGNIASGNQIDGGGIDTDRGAMITNCVVSGNSAPSAFGGGVFSILGQVTIVHSSITGNQARFGGGISSTRRYGTAISVEDCVISGNSARSGGGVYTAGTSTLQISNSTISGNSAVGLGALYRGEGGGVSAALVSVMDSSIDDNTASRLGGGIYATDATITHSTVTHNTAAAGGGAWLKGGTIDESAISDNSATTDGGGVYILDGELMVLGSTINDNTAQVGGGGVLNAAGKLTVASSTISGNKASAGGGISGSATINFSTITANIGGGVQGNADLDSSIVAGNLGSGGGTLDVAGVANAHYSLIGFGAEFLGPLADNGGPTKTHRLLPGSPAIDAGDPNAVAGENGVPEFDQRGEPYSRIVNGRIDIGAVESEGLIVDTLVDESDGNYGAGDLSLREAVEIASLYANTDIIRFAPALTTNGMARIVLTQGELKITSRVTIIGPGANLLTIDASGNDPTPDLNNGDGSRVFDIDDGIGATQIPVAISGLTLTGGDQSGEGGAVYSKEALSLDTVTAEDNAAMRGGAISTMTSISIENCEIRHNSSPDFGGGIWAYGVSSPSAIFIDHTSISDNDCGSGFAVELYFGPATITECNISNNRGGGVSNVGFNSFTMSGCKIADNQGIGLAVDNWGETSIVVSDTVISGNFGSTQAGGANLYATNGTILLSKCLVERNNARNGGGLALGASYGGEIIVDQCTVADNQADFAGGVDIGASGTYPYQFGSVVITRSTISGNRTRGGTAGLAVFDVGGSVRISQSTITGNSVESSSDFQSYGSGGISLYNSISQPVILDQVIVAGNSAPASLPTDFSRQGAMSLRYSLIGSNAGSGLSEAPVGSPDANGNFIGGPVHGAIDPKLGPLVYNGGPVFLDGSRMLTQVLLPGSPAIDAGDPSEVAGVGGVPVNDQRGAPFTRVYGGRIDMGAVESQPNPLAGDYNFNSVVDGADYTVWRDTRGSRTDLRADGNGDGVVNQLDYDVWKANFGTSLPVGAAAGAGLGASVDLVQASLFTIGPSVGGSRALDQTYEPTEGALTQAGSAGASPSQFLLAPRTSLLVGASPNLATAARQDAALLVWLTPPTGGGPRHDGARRDELPMDGATDASADASLGAVDDVFAALAVAV